MSSTERRKSSRFRGQVPVAFEKGMGVTRDFSTSGIYFETDHSFSPAQSLDFSMTLEHTELGPAGRVVCRGEVVRVEPLGERTGVAVAISFYSIEGAGQHFPTTRIGGDGSSQSNPATRNTRG
jgi:hypothetical protein